MENFFKLLGRQKNHFQLTGNLFKLLGRQETISGRRKTFLNQ